MSRTRSFAEVRAQAKAEADYVISTWEAEAKANAVEAVEHDPVRRLIESTSRESSRRYFKALMLAKTPEVCAALLQGERVPLEVLDQEWARKYGLRDG